MAEASRAGIFASSDPLIAVEIWKAAGLFPDRSDGYRALLLVQLSGPLDEAGWHAAAEIVGAALVADEDAKGAEADDRTLTLHGELDLTKEVVRMVSKEIGTIGLDVPGKADAADPEPLVGGIPPASEAAPVPEVELAVERSMERPDDLPDASSASGQPAPQDAVEGDSAQDQDDFWTAARDLLLVETLASGKKIANAALILGKPHADCLARYKKLLPKVTLVEQQSLIKRLRAEAAEG